MLLGSPIVSALLSLTSNVGFNPGAIAGGGFAILLTGVWLALFSGTDEMLLDQVLSWLQWLPAASHVWSRVIAGGVLVAGAVRAAYAMLDEA